jgi:hypothetical protein
MLLSTVLEPEILGLGVEAGSVNLVEIVIGADVDPRRSVPVVAAGQED